MPLCLCGQSKEVVHVQRETEAAVQAALRTNQWSHRTQGESHTWSTWSTTHLVHGPPGPSHTWLPWTTPHLVQLVHCTPGPAGDP